MWQAIQASGRSMVLTVEGQPDDALCSAGGLGNAKRVGHDISPTYNSMASLVDIGSGLWPFAHNSTNATYGGECRPAPSRPASPLLPSPFFIFAPPLNSSSPPLSLPFHSRLVQRP